MPQFALPTHGWLRDLPDLRDFSVDHESVKAMRSGNSRSRSARPASVNLEDHFPPMESKPALAGSVAQSCTALVEYFERKAYGRAFEGSSLFLQKMTSRLLHWKCDVGLPLRATFKTLKRFGLPPSEYWPATSEHLTVEPSAFLFAYAREFNDLVYVRLDNPKNEGGRVLSAVKAFVAAEFPVAFGFSVFDSLSNDPYVPFPSCFDTLRGGQSLVATGYNDDIRVRSERGALRVRSSWGSSWGEAGSGWLPYRYVADNLAADFWTILRPDWLARGELKLPRPDLF
jgi:C1A family cysteine protease